MHLLPHPYAELALRIHIDELITAGMSRRWANIAAVLWLLEQSLKYIYDQL
jgi:hypothetical protein